MGDLRPMSALARMKISTDFIPRNAPRNGEATGEVVSDHIMGKHRKHSSFGFCWNCDLASLETFRNRLSPCRTESARSKAVILLARHSYAPSTKPGLCQSSGKASTSIVKVRFSKHNYLQLLLNNGLFPFGFA